MLKPKQILSFNLFSLIAEVIINAYRSHFSKRFLCVPYAYFSKCSTPFLFPEKQISNKQKSLMFCWTGKKGWGMKRFQVEGIILAES